MADVWSSVGDRFPNEDEIERLVVGPQSVTWQFSSDVRLLLAPLYALLLQVAHPTVAAGVWEHSSFEERPWDRLLRTFDFLLVLQYGGRDAAAAGRQIREIHRTINGVRADGRRYSALEPGAYSWVHATLIETYVRAHQHFGRPMTREQLELFYREFVGLGRLLGVREGELPSSWDGFRVYFDHMVEHELGPNETIDHLLAAVRKPASPGLRFVPEFLWSVLRLPPARLVYLGGVGLMPSSLRERLRLDWRRRDELQFQLISISSRALDPILPAALKTLGPSELRWRRSAIARQSATRCPA